MEQFLFHPKVVHLPIALAMLMPLVAGGLALAWWRDWLPKRAWVIAVVLQGVLVASGFVAMQSGEADEDRVERVVAEHLIDAHEEAAEVFIWSSVAVFTLLLGAGMIRKERIALALSALATVGTLGVLGLAYQVGEAGGSLVYEHGAASAYTARADPVSTVSTVHEDDDD